VHYFNSGVEEYFAPWPKGINCPQARMQELPVGQGEYFAVRLKKYKNP
jgi:hypothetical protein